MENYRAERLFSVQGRTALITGGTSGIGLMMAEGLVANGIKRLFLVGKDAEETVKAQNRLLKVSQKTGAICEVHV
jgi:NAD(P)-dependent dehydrogenase (short-subunit alcohol dehydrogenase family)